MTDMPSEKVMREFAKLALEHATQKIAERAREMANVVPPGTSGRDALLAFARAIESTNAKTWPKEEDETLQ